MNAWLITWEGTVGPALLPDRKIIAILSGRRSAAMVADLVDVLYCRCVDSAHDMAIMSNKRRSREREYLHSYSTSTQLFYGRNPCIFARKIANLKIRRDLRENTELVCWTELPRHQNAAIGAGIEEVEPARHCQLRRTLTPLARDLYE